MYADQAQMIAKKKQTAAIVCLVSAVVLAVSLFLPWLKSTKRMNMSMTLLSIEQCDPSGDHCESMSNLKLARTLTTSYERSMEFRDADDDMPSPKKPGTSFAYFGLVTLGLGLGLIAAAALLAAGILAMTGRFIREPIAITSVGLIVTCLCLITGCIFVAVKPGDAGPMRLLGVSWPFFIFGAAVVAGVAGCQMLAKAFAPPEYDPYADPTQPQL